MPVAEKPAPKSLESEVWIPHGSPPKKLVVRNLRIGTGAKAKAGDLISVQYVGFAYKTGKKFDARGYYEPLTFELGAGATILGWDRGIVGMKVGGRRELIVPPRLAADELGRSETLVYVLQLRSVKSGNRAPSGG